MNKIAGKGKEFDEEFFAARDSGLYEQAIAILDEQIAIHPTTGNLHYCKAYVLHHDLGSVKVSTK